MIRRERESFEVLEFPVPSSTAARIDDVAAVRPFAGGAEAPPRNMTPTGEAKLGHNTFDGRPDLLSTVYYGSSEHLFDFNFY